QPDKLAVAFKEKKVTYKELYERICRIGSFLSSELGIRKNDRVMFTALSKPETVAIYLGIQYCGGVVIFADKNITPENALSLYEDSESVLYITDKPMKGYEDKIRLYSLKALYGCDESVDIMDYQMPEPEDMAEMLFTSGTTGKAKGVVLSYKSVINILTNTMNGIGIREDDRELIPLPLNHSLGLRVMRAVLYRGATVILQNGFVFAKEIEENQKKYECTGLVAVPASMEILRGQMQDMFVPVMSRFRYIEVGAGSLMLEQRKRLATQLPDTTIYNTWGSSETGGALFINVSEAVREGRHMDSIGKPLPHIQVKTINENGEEIAATHDAPGRLTLKGDMEMMGYWKQDELNAQTFSDGWLLTNDLVYRDEDGYVYMLGRADDIINVGGEKVSPIEVENIASEYEYLHECACIGIEDPEKIQGQVPALFVVADDARYSEEDIRRFLAGKMERYKLPQKYILLDKIPRNRMQKIDRKELHRIYREDSDDLMNPVIQAILTRKSTRKFTGAPIPKKQLEMILKAGIQAPTGHNMQTWKFTVIQKEEIIREIREKVERVAKEHKVHFYGFDNPTCLILVSNDRRNANGCQDAACAAENMFLAAHSYGIGSVWLNPLRTICDEPEIRELLDRFEIPKSHIVWSMAGFGYPVANGSSPVRRMNVIKYVE
ncbi:MAG: AMP-binding protein, partial [Eubacteriales bacterium]|nr:AMP-binding protein [Eubacteriales bacterium]